MSTETLTLDRRVPWKTAVIDSEGYVLYDVNTFLQGDTNYTVIRDEHDETIATVRWRDVLPDQIMLRMGTFVSLSNWLKKSIMPMNNDVKVKDDTGRVYFWRRDARTLLLQLFTQEDKSTPIVTFRRSYMDDAAQPSVRVLPTLELTERGQEVRDLAIISIVCLEKGRHTEENNKSRMRGAMMNLSYALSV